MAALHSALQALSPTSYTSVPRNESSLKEYLQDAFRKCQTIIDSVPPPPPADLAAFTRARSNTDNSDASNVSEISVSSARSDPISPANTVLQKEWGKPIKLSVKENPLGMAVYKLAGKDGKGAWFARRSVHEGLGFRKWKLGLQKEFPESLKVQGGPGEGNIRGIGGERLVESISVDGIGQLEVYHLSAQFPGPTTPRDFVTLLLTSSDALEEGTNAENGSPSLNSPKSPRRLRFSTPGRHFIVVSKPCIHPDCPPRDGFIRGEYESVEFIREIPLQSKKSASATDLLSPTRARTSTDMEKEAILRSAMKGSNGKSDGPTTQLATKTDGGSPYTTDDMAAEGRKRGKTISFAESRGLDAKGEAMDAHDQNIYEEAELNPVEWVMITRSDPGGSVPRWMVERGTPSGIVADASKFLDWACRKDHSEGGHELSSSEDTTESLRSEQGQHQQKGLEAYQTNGHLAGINGSVDNLDDSMRSVAQSLGSASQTAQGGFLATFTNAAYMGIESYAPQTVIDRLPGHQRDLSASDQPAYTERKIIPQHDRDQDGTTSISSASFVSATASFASTEDHLDRVESIKSTISRDGKSPKILSPHEKEMVKLGERKKKLDEQLAKAKEKETKDKEELTSKEEDRIRKAEEKHAKEILKQEEKYKREIAKLTAKREREAAKEDERKRKAADKDEKARLIREKDEARLALEVMTKERDILRQQVGELQKENTALVARIGKLGEGKDILQDVRKAMLSRSRSSSSLTRKRPVAIATAQDPTILGLAKEIRSQTP